MSAAPREVLMLLLREALARLPDHEVQVSPARIDEIATEGKQVETGILEDGTYVARLGDAPGTLN